MAEMSESGGGGRHKGGKPSQKKSSTRIDMTPMVDLAFLLLTFFMLTTSFSKPKTMPIQLPDKPKEKKDNIKINENDVLNVLVAPGNQLYYYIGLSKPDVKTASYSPTKENSIRKILIREQNKNFRERAGADSSKFKFTVLIKPADESVYKNLVDIFDEMNISAVRSYALAEISPKELEMIQAMDAKAKESEQ